MQVRIGQYYKAFWSVHGVLGALSFIPPAIGTIMGDSAKSPDYFYPPLGDVKLVAVVATVAFGILSTYIVFACCEGNSRKLRANLSASLFLLGFLSSCLLIGLYVCYVRVIPISNEN